MNLVALNGWFTPRRFAFLLICLLLLAFPDAILLGKSFYFRDYAFFSYPLVTYQKECFWNGELPFWTGYHNLGQPVLAQWNTMTLYPGSLIYLLLPLPWSLNFFCLVHLFIAGMGMFFLVRHLLDHPFAAAFAGLAYVFNGFTLTCLMYPHNTAALGWLPWILWGSIRACRDGGRALPLTALAGAMQFLTGGAEIILQTWFIAGGLVLLDCWQRGWERLAPLRLAGIVVLVTALSAVQLLPFLDLLAHSHRDTGWASDDWSMPVWGWLNFFIPKFGSYPGPQGVYTQFGQAWVNNYYPGCVVTLLALLAVWSSRSRLILTGWLLVLLSLSLAQGGDGWLYNLLKSILPQLGYIRFPIKFITIALVLLPILAAAGLREALNAECKVLLKRLAGLGLLLVFLAFLAARLDLYLLLPDVNWEITLQNGLARVPVFALAAFLLTRFRRLASAPDVFRFALALLALVWADQVLFSSRPNPTTKSWVYRPDLVHAELAFPAQTGPAAPRFLLNAEVQNQLARTALVVAEEQVAYSRLALSDNLNLLDHLPKLHGFYPLDLRIFRDLLPWYHLQPDEEVRPLIEFAGLAYTQSPDQPVEWRQKWNPASLISAGQKPVTLPPDGVLALLENGQFHPTEEVYFYPSETDGLPEVMPGESKIDEVTWLQQEIRFRVQASQPTIVVLAQTYYHPWMAEINGHPTPLRRANHAFTALKVPAGTHQVRLTYVDRKFRLGLLISSIALLIIVSQFSINFKKLPPGQKTLS